MSLIDSLKQIGIGILLPAVKEFGKTEIEAGLELVEGKDHENFATDLQGGYSMFKRLDAVLKANSIGEGLVSAVLDAFRVEAAKHNITLV